MQRLHRFAILGIVVVALSSFAASCDRGSDDEQVQELEQQVSDLEAELDQTQQELEIQQGQNEELQTQVDDTQAQLTDTQAQLADTQTQLTDAQTQLAQVGELKLEDGTYIGQVLGAHASPNRVLIFDAAGLFRVAQIAQDVTITSGGQTFSLSEFGRLLASTDPDDAKLANGNYQIKIQGGLVFSITKSKK
jgi:multidrug efflux pump subunit AcrA (membrane-fusion protein)